MYKHGTIVSRALFLVALPTQEKRTIQQRLKNSFVYLFRICVFLSVCICGFKH